MEKGKKLYKVTIEEKISQTAYIYALNEDDARYKAIFTDIEVKSNQDFEQTILDAVVLKSSEYPIGVLINN